MLQPAPDVPRERAATAQNATIGMAPAKALL